MTQEAEPNPPATESTEGPDATRAEAPVRKRPKPGERRIQILQALASMLEQPGAERITTAALAARLEVSEAALYRHFASKAQMYEGLIEFIEQTLFGLINKITAEETSGLKQADAIVPVLLGFAVKNPGMTRVLIGDALVHENERLQVRINQLHDRVEAQIKQSLRFAVSQGELPQDRDITAQANVIIAFVIGKRARNVSAADALSYVGGYAALGSVSLSFTLLARPSPVFFAVIVKPMASPASTVAASAFLVKVTSGFWQATLSLAVWSGALLMVSLAVLS